MSVKIYHNPRCSKSRATLAILEDEGIDPEIIEYLQSPPDAETLAEILQLLGRKPAELMRTGEDEYKQAHDSMAAMSDDEKIVWMTENPRVIERPIVVTPKGARVGRPPESIREIL
jgi:arsenate reductase